MAPRLTAAPVLLLAAALVGCGERLPPPTGDRVLLIGVDAATWTVMRPLIDAGALPTLARLEREGWSGTLRSLEPMFSPRLWTSIATGKTPERHGIEAFLADPGDGAPPVPVTSNLRRTEALWTIASRAGRRVNTIGWYVTWPVEPVNGVMVSDRFPPHDLPDDPGGSRAPSAEHPPVHPPGLVQELERLCVTADDFLDPAEREFHRKFNIYPVDASRVAIAEHLMQRRPADLTMVYLSGIDPTQHLFWRYHDPAHWVGPPATPEEMRGGRLAVPESYQDVDAFVARLLAHTGRRDTVLVVSDHGAGPVEAYDPATGISGAHRIEGVIVAWGNHVRRGPARTPPSILDVTPTVLHLLGLPIGADMDGAVIEDLLDPAFLAAHPVRRIATYDTGARPAAEKPIPSDMDRSIRERLRALGYIQ